MKYIKPAVFIIFIAISLFFLSSCLFDEEESDEIYPTVIYALADSELTILQNGFDDLNDNKIETRLDQFGLTSSMYVSHTVSDNSLTDTNTVLQMAKAALIKNSKYTNITGKSKLSVDRVYSHSNIGWRVRYNEQVYEGLKVLKTKIEVFLDANGVYRIDNHFYKDIMIPDRDMYSDSEARVLLIGKEIEFYCWSLLTYTVTTSSFSDKSSQKVIVPVQTDTQIEFRVTWEIFVGVEDGFGWYIYIDTTTGEEVLMMQTFIC